MSTLIFQIQLKQWDKSERTPAHIAARASLPNTFEVLSKPEFLILECQCIIDRHGESGPEKNRKLKTALLKDGSVQLERFLIKKDAELMSLSYQNEQGQIEQIGELNSGWIQASYTWRKRVNENNQLFWLYEELTLNIALMESVKTDHFLVNSPQKIINIDE